MAETEFLAQPGLAEAEADGALRYAASTYDAASDRIVPGLGRPGPRVVDFAPVLVWGELPLVPALRRLLGACEDALHGPVEIEFAVSLPQGGPARLGLLQVRPLLVSSETVDVAEQELRATTTLVASTAALGNGRREVRDVVFVDPARFETRLTPQIACEIERINRDLVETGRPYLLIGFGRWGSADPWLGIPVRFDQIAGACGIVEATLPSLNPEPSQGSHFFHNLQSLSVLYFTVRMGPASAIDWEWLASQASVGMSDHVRHVRTEAPLVLRVDGRSRRGVVSR
jgi:hypothetical protein